MGLVVATYTVPQSQRPYTWTAIVQLTENTRVFYSVSVNFRKKRMSAGEHTITQRLRASTINFGKECLDSGAAAISRDTGRHTAGGHASIRANRQRSTHTNQQKGKRGYLDVGWGTQPRQQTHRRGWPQYISRRLRLTRNVNRRLNHSARQCFVS